MEEKKDVTFENDIKPLLSKLDVKYYLEKALDESIYSKLDDYETVRQENYNIYLTLRKGEHSGIDRKDVNLFASWIYDGLKNTYEDASSEEIPDTGKKPVTYLKDIQPILSSGIVDDKNPPLNLNDYVDVKRDHYVIYQVLKSRGFSPNYPTQKGEKDKEDIVTYNINKKSDKEINLFAAWIYDGLQEGETSGEENDVAAAVNFLILTCLSVFQIVFKLVLI